MRARARAYMYVCVCNLERDTYGQSHRTSIPFATLFSLQREKERAWRENGYGGDLKDLRVNSFTPRESSQTRPFAERVLSVSRIGISRRASLQPFSSRRVLLSAHLTNRESRYFIDASLSFLFFATNTARSLKSIYIQLLSNIEKETRNSTHFFHRFFTRRYFFLCRAVQRARVDKLIT